ncbi:hypothetical protein KCU93_g9467, partial [Aureobasidium melanogenum]
MEYHQACVTTGANHHPIYAHHNQGYTHTPPVWSAVPQYSYGYEQHPLAAPVGDAFNQAPIMTSGHTTPAEPIVVDGHNGVGGKHRIGLPNERFEIANASECKN